MPNGELFSGNALDEASRAFLSFERALGRRATSTTRSREDANTVRALVGAWFKTYRPQVAQTLGEFPAIEDVDRILRGLLSRAGSRMVIADLRADLRAVARKIDRDVAPAYDAARWTSAAAQPVTAIRQTLTARLERLSPDLAASYRQVHTDLANSARNTFMGPAGEIREVMRAAIHLLAPEEDVRAQSWYEGYEGHPTQAERIRYIVQQRANSEASPVEAADVVDTKVARLGRTLYSRASKAFHVGTQRDELERIVSYVEAVLVEILPS